MARGAVPGRLRVHLGADIAHVRREARAQCALHDAHAHGAGAYHADPHRYRRAAKRRCDCVV
jgi:hypothetical protein